MTRSHLVDDGVDDLVEQAGDLGRPAARSGPRHHEERDEGGGEQHERVLGGGLAASPAQAPAGLVVGHRRIDERQDGNGQAGEDVG